MNAIIGRTHMGALRIALVLAAAVAAAVAANLILLGVAGGSEPVGTLSPRAGIVGTRLASTVPIQPAPTAATRRGDDARPGNHSRGDGDD